MKQIRSKQLILRTVAIGEAVLMGATCFALTPQGQAQNESKTTPLNIKIDETPINRNQPLMDSFASIIQKVAPSVVKILSPLRVRDKCYRDVISTSLAIEDSDR
jgi:hypothetical protein